MMLLTRETALRVASSMSFAQVFRNIVRRGWSGWSHSHHCDWSTLLLHQIPPLLLVRSLSRVCSPKCIRSTQGWDQRRTVTRENEILVSWSVQVVLSPAGHSEATDLRNESNNSAAEVRKKKPNDNAFPPCHILENVYVTTWPRRQRKPVLRQRGDHLLRRKFASVTRRSPTFFSGHY